MSIAALTFEPVLCNAYSWLCKRQCGYVRFMDDNLGLGNDALFELSPAAFAHKADSHL